MKHGEAGAIVLSASLLALASCAHLPILTPVPGEAKVAAVAGCRAAFPPRPWRATHVLFATLPFGLQSQLLGVTSAEEDGLHAVLLSPEGVALFEGHQQAGLGPAGLLVKRAISPFDRAAYAASLMADVGSAFLQPPGEPAVVGRSESGATVCRWSPPAGETTDVELAAGGPRMIRTFRNLHLTRAIALAGPAADGFFPLVQLVVPGAGGYALEMRLIDHE